MQRDQTRRKAELDKREHELAQLRNDLAVAQAKVQRLEAPLDQERLRIAELRLEQAQATLQTRQEAVSRAQALLELGAVAPQAVQNAELAAIDAEADVQSAERGVIELREGVDPVDLERARLRVEDLQRQVGSDDNGRKTGMLQELSALRDRMKRELMKHRAAEQRLVRRRHDVLSATHTIICRSLGFASVKKQAESESPMKMSCR